MHLLHVQLVPSAILLCLFVYLGSSHDVTRNQQSRNQLRAKWDSKWSYSTVSTFAGLPQVRCLTDPDKAYDIAIVGAPFDGAVSYRPGARFGPRAIRTAAARQSGHRGYNARARLNPFRSWATIFDCGDIPISPYDNALALRQMSEAFDELGARQPPKHSLANGAAYLRFPKLLALGGDHSIALPALRALKQIHGGALSVLHFDAHLDTWDPSKYRSVWDDGDEAPQHYFNHGSMFWIASQEGLIANGSSVHAGLRTRLSGTDESDYEEDSGQGWARITTDDIDEIGAQGIIDLILKKIGTEKPVYLSVDIDVLDPGTAPGTGTPEPGGWSMRELIRILRGIDSLNVVGADIVEVSPAYDGASEVTALAAAQVGFEVLTSMVKRGLMDMGIPHSASPASSLKDEL